MDFFRYIKIFDAAECEDIYNHLNGKDFEYHKEYMRFGKMVKVPRGQASYTLNEEIHYDYGVSGGSPVNEIMDVKLKQITENVNLKLGTTYNTILMNVYVNGDDSIAFHKESDWAENPDMSLTWHREKTTITFILSQRPGKTPEREFH
jgi:alkylated DNA repair dioxygenase AlkB